MNSYCIKLKGEKLNHVAYPLGGIGAGMFCLQGNGMLGSFSLRNKPDIQNEPNVFSAVCIKNKNRNFARIIEGKIPYHKIFGVSGKADSNMGNGLHGKNYGLPRFKDNDFSARFPFATLNFYDDGSPIDVKVTGWSPFIPLDADASSNPIAALEYTFTNNSNEALDCIYYFNAFNFMGLNNESCVYRHEKGFTLYQPPSEDEPHIQGAFCATVYDDNTKVNTDWFIGKWFDTITMQWNDIKAGRINEAHNKDNKSPGASIAVPFTLEPNKQKTIVLKFAWFAPLSNVRHENHNEQVCEGCKNNSNITYRPWYSAKFKNVEQIMQYFSDNYNVLKEKTEIFTDSFFDSTAPDIVLEAVSANLCILKSPTVLRQTDGRLWCYEGCCDSEGSCYGSCTHVWNYAQAFCHLFPDLERTLRMTEFNECQDSRGHQEFRAPLPIRKATNEYYAAADGQLGGIMKMYREWEIGGDIKWIKKYWNKIKISLDYCIKTWDKNEEGVLKEPHHNTYDIEFWGADSMCSSFYIGALKAACMMGEEIGEDVDKYHELYHKGKNYIETKLFNGEYFYQEINKGCPGQTPDCRDKNGEGKYSFEKEGPKYQYGQGCLSDGIVGAWLAKICGLGDILDKNKTKSHLNAVYKYNYKTSLYDHENPQRPGYAIGNEGGLILCTWPNGGKPSLPFVYSSEVWTGIEYQVASHLILMGETEKGLEIVKTCRARYDGTKRNPFNEYECGHWYARALASFALLQSISGAGYDAVSKTLYLSSHDNYRAFLCTESGYATVGNKNGKAFVDVKSGKIDINEIIKK